MGVVIEICAKYPGGPSWLVLYIQAYRAVLIPACCTVTGAVQAQHTYMQRPAGTAVPAMKDEGGDTTAEVHTKLLFNLYHYCINILYCNL
jgi:hypothetical protein